MKKLMVFLFMSLFLFSFASASTLDNASIYYSLDNDTVNGSTVIDLSVNLLNSTNNGATTGVTGLLVDSFEFDGINDYLNSGNVGQTTGDMSISVWFYRDTNNNNWECILCKSDATIGGGSYILASMTSATTSGTLRFRLDDSSTGFIQVDSSVTPSNGVWNHLVAVYNGNGLNSGLSLYLNGVDVSTGRTGTFNGVYNSNEDLRVGSRTGASAGEFFDGKIDEIALYDFALNSSQISDLYNSGSGFNPYTAETDFVVTVTDEWDGSAVNNVSLILNFPGGTPPFTTYTNSTGNVIYTGLLKSDGNVYNFTITGEDYFDKAYIDYNTSSSLTATLNQSQISFNGFNLLGDNVTNETTFVVGGQTNGTFPLKAGTYNVTAVYGGYSVVQEFTVTALDVKTVNVTSLYNQIMNITATETITGSTINNFNIILTDGTYTYNQNTTNGYLEIPTLINTNYSVTISGTNITTTQVYLENDTSYYAYEFIIYTQNSFYINFYNSETEALINDRTINFDYFSDTDYDSLSTSNGTIYITLLTPDDYTFQFNATNYTNNYYFVTLQDDTAQNLTLYMTPTGTDGLTNVTIEVIDGSAALIDGAIVKALKHFISDNTYQEVGSGTTNTEGETVIPLILNTEFYKFNVVIDGESVLLTNAFVLTKNTLRIQVITEEDYLASWTAYRDINSNLVFNTATDSFRLDITSGTSREYCLNTYQIKYTGNELINNTCFTGTTGTIIHTVGGSPGENYYSEATYNGQFLVSEYYSYSLIDMGSAGLVVQILLTIMFGLAGIISAELLLVTTPLSLVVGFMIGLHTIGYAYTVPLLIVGFLIMIYLRKNG